MSLYMKTTWNIPKATQETFKKTLSEFNNVAGYRVFLNKSLVFLYTNIHRER